MFENDAFIVFSKKEKSCNITSPTLKLEVGVILQSSDLLDDQKECLLSAFLHPARKSLKEITLGRGGCLGTVETFLLKAGDGDVQSITKPPPFKVI